MSRVPKVDPDPRNLARLFAAADAYDKAEGLLAYPRYNEMMRRIADRYKIDLPLVVAAFVSLSPNSDYLGNLRSLVSVLDAFVACEDVSMPTVSTYKHCRQRAWDYLSGHRDFERDNKGPKVFNFYRNIVDPLDARWVTIDGHMVGAWLDLPLTMKDASIGKRSYATIKNATIALASVAGIAPSAFQATVWFARKRLLKVRYSAQLSMFHEGDDVWRTLHEVDDIRPYPRQQKLTKEASVTIL